MKNKQIPKCVKIQSIHLDKEQTIILRRLFKKCQKCKNHIYSQFGGIASLAKILDPKKLRTEMLRYYKKKGYLLPEKRYKFLNKHWVRSILDACANIKSNWSNLANELKKLIRENENLSTEEKSYLYYVVSVPSLWYAVLNRKHIEETSKMQEFGVSEERKRYLFNYLRRITRNRKPKVSKSNNLKSMSLDQKMYTIETDENESYVFIATDVPYKRIKVKLKSKWCYPETGNVQLVFYDNKKGKAYIEIHKAIKTKERELDKTQIIGIDKGYSTLLSCSSDKEYGIDIGELFNQKARKLNKMNTNRNYFFSLLRDYKKQLEEIEQILLAKPEEEELYKPYIETITDKIAHIEAHHIGSKRYNKQNKKAFEMIKNNVNHSIKQMIEAERPSKIIKENLTFDNGSSNKGRTFNQRMKNWNKGYLDERLEYVSSLYGIKTEDVNPAYTSQFCSQCGTKIIRKGEHHSIADCSNCGKLNANINAGKNILARYRDSEITIYTPYKKVEKILLERYKNNFSVNTEIL